MSAVKNVGFAKSTSSMAASRWLPQTNELHVCGTFQFDKSRVGDSEPSYLWVGAISFTIKSCQILLTFVVLDGLGPGCPLRTRQSIQGNCLRRIEARPNI